MNDEGKELLLSHAKKDRLKVEMLDDTIEYYAHRAIGDPVLLKQIQDGQKSSWPFADFADFPYYSTFAKIGQSAKESNCLSQMWAWATSDNSSPLATALKSFVVT